MGKSLTKEKFEVIIPERTFIVDSLEEAREILNEYGKHSRGIIIKRMKEEEK